eukprot:8034586-Ditylum_brightwellii.AAC.1
MPAEAIDRVHKLARHNPSGIAFYDQNGNVYMDEEEDDADNSDNPDYDPNKEPSPSDDEDEDDGANDDDDNDDHQPPGDDTLPTGVDPHTTFYHMKP